MASPDLSTAPAPPETAGPSSVTLLSVMLHLVAFLVGAIVMGFEMLGSRYLYPFFGGSITTWAALISVVLAALMIGYFAGGLAADRWPRPAALAVAILLAALYMALVPIASEPVFQWIFSHITNPAGGALAAAAALSLLPLALLGSFTPFAIRLTLRHAGRSGSTAGRLYAVSTFGNITGTLVTTFVLMPELGSRSMTWWFAGAATLCGLWVLALERSGNKARPAGLPGLLVPVILALVALPLFALPLFASEAEARDLPLLRGLNQPLYIDGEAAYPEGPLVLDDKLFYAEMGADRLSVIEAGRKQTFWQEDGCGPTSVAPWDGGLVVLCHYPDMLVALDRQGRVKRRWTSDADGNGFLNPNDSSADGQGGVWFSASGHFHPEAPSQGRLLYLDAEGILHPGPSGFHYANGVLVQGNRLLMSEHLGRRVLSFRLTAPGQAFPDQVFTDFNGLPRGRKRYQLAGPDGIEPLPDGKLLIPEYGEGRVLLLDAQGKTLGRIPVPFAYVTNVAVDEEKGLVYMVGARDNMTPPFPGAVIAWPLSPFLDAVPVE